MHKINVLYCFDNKFWKTALVSMCSLMHNKNADTEIDIYCMVPQKTSNWARWKIQRTVRKFKNCRLIWRKIIPNENPFETYDFKKWHPVIFYRLFAHKIFPNLDRMLYLDSDTLIFGDLWELFQTDMGDNVIGAVRDMALVDNPNNYIGQYVREFTEKHMKGGHYINSGVLLMDMTKRAELDSLGQPIDSKQLVCPDQDLLNMRFAGRILYLSLKYNFTYAYLPSDYDKTDAENARSNYVIYHFYTRKPFQLHYHQRDLFAYYTKMCKIAGTSPMRIARHEDQFTPKKTHIPGIKIVGNRIKLFGITVGQI